ncbi:MAG: carbon-nitrogen hydrolase family protein [Bdellovibrionales bacterium]|nr:carbon-nitrogen hydrolase family protein [Bdellovibrionales bacterium]
MNNFRLAVAQLTSTDDIAVNLTAVEAAYAKAATESAQLVVFPENTLYFRIQSGSPLLGPGQKEMAQLQRAVDLGKTALMLTTALPTQTGKFRNGTLLFRAGQLPEMLYSKIHLFDVDVPGAPPVRESDHFEAGEAPKQIEIDGWNFGLSICYDLRFAELYLKYAQKADVILVPSAFLVPTGEAHWHTLLRARAIENQCYMAAPAQSGEHRSRGQVRHTYGHSLVVDPWGQVLADLTGSPEVRVVELQREAIHKVRRQIPMSDHRRL